MRELRVVRKQELSAETAQTPGMRRLAAIDSRTGATGLWVGHVTMEPGAESAPHHHGECQSVIYVTAGRAKFRWGQRLEQSVEAGAGDFIYIPPHLVHQEINMRDAGPVECIVVRDREENIVVNVDLPEAAPGR